MTETDKDPLEGSEKAADPTSEEAAVVAIHGGLDDHDARQLRRLDFHGHDACPTRRSRYWPYEFLRIGWARRATCSASM